MCYTHQAAECFEEESENEQEDDLDINVFATKFDDQLECQARSTTNTISRCSECQAIVHNEITQIEKNQYQQLYDKALEEIRKYFVFPDLLQNDQFIWICEFCGKHNILSKTAFIPASADCCFELPLSEELIIKQESQIPTTENQIPTIYFVIDVSSSMGEFHKDRGIQSRQDDDSEDEMLDFSESKNKTMKKYTRLEMIKQALIEEINRMKDVSTKANIGLITFGSSIKIYGYNNDHQQKLVYSQQKHSYLTFEKILSEIEEKPFSTLNVMKESQTIQNQILDMSTHGCTSLGMALLSGIQLASRGNAGSKVIICTDGMANTGIGSIGEKGCEQFYRQAGEHAREKQVVVNILTIKGDSGCSISNLSKTCLLSNGIILRVDPSKIGTEFQKIIEDEIIGTSAVATIRLNQTFKFRNTDVSEIKETIGNFNSDTGLTYEFDAKQKQLTDNVSSQLFDLMKRPMQLELKYRSVKTGLTYISTFTDWRKFAIDKDELFGKISFNVIKNNFFESQYKLIKANEFNKALQLQGKLKQELENILEQTITLQEKADMLKKIGEIEMVINSKNKKFLQKNGKQSRSSSSESDGSEQDSDSSLRNKNKTKNMNIRSQSRSRSSSKEKSQESKISNNMNIRSQSRSRSSSKEKSQESKVSNRKHQKGQIPAKKNIIIMESDDEEEILLSLLLNN